MSHVVFGVDGARYPAEFNQGDLKLGEVVYVTWDSSKQPTFTSHEVASAERLYVAWIAPSEWYVDLVRPRKAQPQEVHALVQVLGHLFSQDDLETAANFALGFQFSYQSAQYRKTELFSLLRVADRLEFCKRLDSEEIGKALHFFWGPLVEYHYLTCFDVLGQPDGWLTFGSWLASKKHKAERERAISPAQSRSICQMIRKCFKPKDPSEAVVTSKKLLEAYEEMYGARRSFIRFIREILPPAARAELFNSVQIQKSTLPPQITPKPDGNQTDKENYLYRIRNEYTHKATIRGDFQAAAFKEIMPPGHEGMFTWREQSVEAKELVTVMTMNWPTQLKKAVIAGMAYRVELLLEAARKSASK